MKNATKLETEGDGSLVVNGVVVFSPSADFTAAQIRAVVAAHNSHAALAARVKELERALNESDACLALMTSHAKNYMHGGFPLPLRGGEKHCAEHLLADRIEASHEIARRALTEGAT